MKVLHEAFLYLHFRFELSLAQEFWRKCTHIMLVKLTTGRQIRFEVIAIVGVEQL
jgi:hypothetical protein